MASYGRYDDRRHSSSSRRDSSPSRHRRDSRRSSPGPSRERSPKPRDDKELPEQFGRGAEERKDDDYTVIQRMKKSYTNSPLGCIYKCIDGSRKLKVWTRNFKEVRGICTGYVIAFDKHWNLVMTDVDEVYLKPRKSKTPYLSDVKSGDNIPELEPKVPKKKKDPSATATAAPTTTVAPVTKTEEVDDDEPEIIEIKIEKPETEKSGTEKTEKKKKRKKKKKGPTTERRHIKQLFVRGDNIVMVAVLDTENEEEVEDEEETKE